MQKSSTEIRVFISSTFHDLHDEREHLVKKIFPEIRTLCRERGVTFTEIDLRWGVTEEQSALGHVLRTCLEEVDKCSPFFIGMFGKRYGWVPQISDVEKDPELLARYPWIREAVINRSSATELEIIQGVFTQDGRDEEGEEKGRSAYFYRRNTSPEELENPEKLEGLIASLEDAGHPVREFDDVEGLGRMIRDDLLDLVERCRPEEYLPTGVELKRRAHAAFAASRRRAYISDAEYMRRFTDWLHTGSAPLLISGPSGLGKSSLMAVLIDHYRETHPEALVIEHYVGAAETSGSSYGVMRHVIEEMWERFVIEEEMPTAPEKIERKSLQRGEQEQLQCRIVGHADPPVNKHARLLFADVDDLRFEVSGGRRYWRGRHCAEGAGRSARSSGRSDGSAAARCFACRPV